jgi:Fe-S oxidoreductase
MATREEMHSTRGRARLLFEMLRGDPLRRTWKDDRVREALDLCLACKGCKGECPVNVDMATYKAEFLSHYYEGRLRPVHAYVFGLMYVWAKIAAKIPRFVNAVTGAPAIAPLLKRIAGIAPQRTIPPFAPATFRDWFRSRKEPGSCDGKTRQTVILWPDTWNNHFHPTTAIAAVEVLEDAGFRVEIPRVQLCCGRPLYDFGMLDSAKRLLHDVLDALREPIRAGVCVVGLEPSCVSVFRDEMVNLLGDDKDAERLRGQTFLLSEFLEKYAPDYAIPSLDRQAVVHQHCHHKATLDASSETKLFDRMGLQYRMPDTGCCGMAGAFGFQEQHYDLSVQLAERVLLPSVREAGEDTLVVADGFSCREQIAQLSSRRALHPAQVMKMAIDRRDGRPSHPPQTPPRSGKGAWLVAVAASIAGAILVFQLRRRGR